MKASIEFEMGEKTCSVEFGKFCRWCRSTHLGLIPVCTLFEELPLAEKDGLIQRCKECMEQFPPQVNGEPA